MAPSKTSELSQQKSPAEFFAENRNIAGFDNPGKCLYTTVRELVENSLDSAESINEQPDISITIEEISQNYLNKVRGIENHERLDEQLYQDYENDDAKKKRLAKEAREMEKLEKAHAKKGGDPSELEAEKKKLEAKRAAKEAQNVKVFYKVTVKDNGTGMPHKDIPNLLGQVLSGTKYGVQQTRGKFGLGAKMALIWSKMSTGLPMEIWSAQTGQTFVSHYVLDIDIHKNAPNVHKEQRLKNEDRWHGAKLSVTISGSWQNVYRSKILKYLQQIAVITPYAKFDFTFTSKEGQVDKISFSRRTNSMPRMPQVVKHHPASVDLELVKRLVQSSTAKSLQSFLHKEFSNISKEYAARLIEESRSGMDPKMQLSELTTKQLTRLHQLFHEAKFRPPDGDHLSPAGEYNLRLGIIKELHPDFLATFQGDVGVLEGHAFIVEAAVCFGADEMRPGITVHRFANRIPLLFEAGSDVVTKTATKRINWTTYKMNKSSDKIGVFVSIVSTKIPYKGAGKEYISDDMEVLVEAVRAALRHCCAQLKVKISRRNAIREEEQRRKLLLKYVKDAAFAVYKATSTAVEDVEEMERQRKQRVISQRKREAEEEDDMLERIKRRKVSERDVADKLMEYVERIDTEQALEYHMQQGQAGTAKSDVALMPKLREHTFGPLLQANCCTLRVIQS